MTIKETYKEIEGLIIEHHIYGIETIINSVVQACNANKIDYTSADAIHALVDHAFDRLAWVSKQEDNDNDTL